MSTDMPDGGYTLPPADQVTPPSPRHRRSDEEFAAMMRDFPDLDTPEADDA